MNSSIRSLFSEDSGEKARPQELLGSSASVRIDTAFLQGKYVFPQFRIVDEFDGPTTSGSKVTSVYCVYYAQVIPRTGLMRGDDLLSLKLTFGTLQILDDFDRTNYLPLAFTTYKVMQCFSKRYGHPFARDSTWWEGLDYERIASIDALSQTPFVNEWNTGSISTLESLRGEVGPDNNT